MMKKKKHTQKMKLLNEILSRISIGSKRKEGEKKKERLYSPTTSKSLVAISVWNDGASADTSQLYFPVTDGCTWANDTWLSFDPERWKKENTQMKKLSVTSWNCWSENREKCLLRKLKLRSITKKTNEWIYQKV